MGSELFHILRTYLVTFRYLKKNEYYFFFFLLKLFFAFFILLVLYRWLAP